MTLKGRIASFFKRPATKLRVTLHPIDVQTAPPPPPLVAFLVIGVGDPGADAGAAGPAGVAMAAHSQRICSTLAGDPASLIAHTAGAPSGPVVPAARVKRATPAVDATAHSEDAPSSSVTDPAARAERALPADDAAGHSEDASSSPAVDPAARVERATPACDVAGHSEGAPSSSAADPAARVERALPACDAAGHSEGAPSSSATDPAARVERATPAVDATAHSEDAPSSSAADPAARVERALPACDAAGHSEDAPSSSAADPAARVECALPAVDAAGHSEDASSSPAVNPTADARARFPYTQQLLSQLVRGILADPGGYILRVFNTVFLRICDDLINSQPYSSHVMDIEKAMDGSLELITDHLRKGIPICVTSVLEQPESGTVQWGLTNRKVDRKDECGYLVPALNWSHCSAFEATFNNDHPDPVILRRRSQLGSLLAVTFLHELNHVFSRVGLKNVLDIKEFLTPEVDIGKEGAGREFEWYVFKGVIQARWKLEDITNHDRFTMIQDVWLQAAFSPDKLSNFRLISDDQLSGFFNEIFFNATLTRHTILDYFFKNENPSLPYATVARKDRILLRGTLPGAVMAPPLTYGPPANTHCAVELERLAKKYPKSKYAKMWSYYE
ncbi:hypothetical protein C8R45DRAFT_1166747 [Mycena sanguinolenta]|nr:hypothetical protein C8R45DRAFT_1166747 [Mycena sanguinolenta]